MRDTKPIARWYQRGSIVSMAAETPTTIRWDPGVLARLDEYAAATRRSRNAAANYLVDSALRTEAAIRNADSRESDPR